MANQFILVCSTQPPPGGACPAGGYEWIPYSTLDFQAIRDFMVGMPNPGDVAVVATVAITLAIFFNLPHIVNKIIAAVGRVI